MLKIAKHPRIPELPFINSLQASRLDHFFTEQRGSHQDLLVDYHELCLSAPPELTGSLERPLERVQGVYVPRRLRFVSVRALQVEGLYTHLIDVPEDHPVRGIRSMMSWICPDDNYIFSLFAHGSAEHARLWITSRSCVTEEPPKTADAGLPIAFTRDWSPPPPFRPGLVPSPPVLHRTFGGDPVTFRLGQRIYHRRLFVGDLECQSNTRPQVDAVLNIGEEPSCWTRNSADSSAERGSPRDRVDPRDRWVIKGEGNLGMSPADIASEAQWVIERLKQGKHVLVHCVAGLNRSTTICCAVLILLEGLSAQSALDRVRNHHAWARPDEHHWLALKYLANRA